MKKVADVAVIGGGLAGLAAAALLANEGRSVALFEKSGQIGGRAVTRERSGFRFNMGAHSLYLNGAGEEVLRRLGVRYAGSPPDRSRQELQDGETIDFGSLNMAALAKSTVLTSETKEELAQFMKGLRQSSPASLAGTPVSDWLGESLSLPQSRRFMEAVMRLALYTADADTADAGYLATFLAGFSDVWYLDGGWGTLVDGLRQAALRGNVQIAAGARAAAVQPDGSGYKLHLADGGAMEAQSVILATDPKTAADLLRTETDNPIRTWAERAKPVQAAALDLALRRLPDPGRTFVLRLDRPYYYSVHSAAAELAPEGMHLVHLLKYLKADDSMPPDRVRDELEQWLDELQSGWRDEVIERQFLPRMTVANDRLKAADGGLAGRPGPAVPGYPGLYVAGDWVGAEGQLADAGFASARQAARLILQG